MSSLQIGNGNWAVKEDNLLGFRYDETEGVYFPREMTFSRASDGTRVNPDGLIERVPYNLIQYSEDFTQWIPGESPTSVSSNSVTFGVSYGSRVFIAQNSIAGTTITISATFSSDDAGKSVRLGVFTGSWDFGSNILIPSNGFVSRTVTLSANLQYIGVVQSTLSTYTTLTLKSGFGVQVNEGSTAKDYFPTTNRQDIARIDYSSGTGALLLEPQRTNLLQYSEQFDESSYWSPVQSTITANDTIAPDGQTTADKMLASATTGNHQIDGSFFSIVSGAVTSSIYAKKGNTNFVRLRHNSTTQQIRAWFDLENGVVGSVDAGGSATIEDAGNGWYRCTMTESGNTKTGLAALQIFINESDGQTTWTADGDEYIYLWGAQVEQGSYATSYIPTTSASVTRLTDKVYNSSIDDTTGTHTYIIDFEFTNTSDEMQLLHLYNTTTTKGVTATINAFGNSGVLGIRGRNGGSDFGSSSFSGCLANTKYTLQFDVDYTSLTITNALLNNASPDGTVSARLDTATNGLYLGSRVNDYFLSGEISKFEII